MAKRAASRLSVADLEKMLADAKRETDGLQKERDRLSARLAKVDQRLAELAGTSGRRGPGRPAKATAAKAAAPAARKGKKPGRKKMTMPEHVARILQASKGAMSPGEIAAALKKKGVSMAKTLATQVNQILKSDKVKAKKVGRGQYVAADDV